jgi:hypothetical protein
MANGFIKTLDVLFEEFVENYDAACVLSTQAERGDHPAQEMQRAGDTFYVKQDYMTAVQTGMDISGGSATDVIERVVPTTFRQPDNVRFDLDALELRDPEKRGKYGKAASLRLASEVDKNLMIAVGTQASIVQKNTTAFAWTMGVAAEAALTTRGISTGQGQIKLFMNPTDYQPVAIDLGNRAYIGATSAAAYEQNQVPSISLFKTYRTDNYYNLAAIGTVSGTTVNGAQSFTPSAMTSNLPTDNRRMTLTVAGANIANTKNGDAFTIAGVNAVHMIDKSDTGQLQTFRIISGAGTTSLVITPAIIATGPYQNVSAVAANGAALVFLNTVTKPVNPFWKQGAVTIDYGRPAFAEFNGAGVQVMSATTKQGVPLAMMAAANVLTGKMILRFTTMYAATVLLPEQCGIILANQT